MARFNQTENNRPESYIHSVRNAETVAIPKGTPVILNLSLAAQPTTASDGHAIGYEDGLQVVLPSTAGAVLSVLYNYGVALNTIPAGLLGEVQVHGVIPAALFVRATRSASTASWSGSATSSAVGGFLVSIDTVNNAFASYAASYVSLANASSVVSSAGLGQGFIANAVVLDSLASVTASASATSDTRVNLLTLQRAFVRQM